MHGKFVTIWDAAGLITNYHSNKKGSNNDTLYLRSTFFILDLPFSTPQMKAARFDSGLFSLLQMKPLILLKLITIHLNAIDVCWW